MAVKCNRTIECPRGEDEADCGNCHFDQFECANSKCIPKRWLCDQNDDCGDKSDEQNCSNSSVAYVPRQQCHEHMFDCLDGGCVEQSVVCNGHPDCRNERDESDMCKVPCTNSVCAHNCRSSPYGPTCSCRDGYILAGDRKACYDIDECRVLRPCSQKCVNTPGSFRCECFDNYMLRGDKVSCKSVYARESMVYNSFNIVYNVSQRGVSRVLQTNDSLINGIDANVRQGLIYYTHDESQSLFEFNVTSNQTKYIAKIGRPKLLAVDWSTNNAYVLDLNHPPSIKICNIADKACVRLLLFFNSDSVKSLAVDPVNNRMFYPILHDFMLRQSVIYSLWLDGTHPEVLVNNADHVSDVTCDPNKKILYYSEINTKSIWVIGYDGQGRRQIIASDPHVMQPISIGLLEDEMTIFNLNSNKAARCKMYGARECRSFLLNAYNSDNLVLMQESRQPIVANKCAAHRCGVICVPAERGPKCLCGDGVHVHAGEQCPNVVVKSEVNTLAGGSGGEEKRIEEESHAVGLVVGLLTAFMCILLLAMSVFVAYKKKLIRKRFVARVHFQNPTAAFANCGSPLKIAAVPTMNTGIRHNEIFLNDINSDDVSFVFIIIIIYGLVFNDFTFQMSECGSSAPSEDRFIYANNANSLKTRLIDDHHN